jgi:Flp pilus assembly protein CpaB
VKQRIVLLIAAVLLAATGAVAIYSYTSKADSRALSGQQAVRVVVASSPIAGGASATSGKTTTEKYPRNSLPQDAVTDLDQVSGQVAVSDIQRHQVLTTSMFGARKDDAEATPAKAAGATVPKGQVAVPVSFTSFVNGEDWLDYVRPGADVAIFLTYVPIDPQTGKAIRITTDAKGDDDKKFDHETRMIVAHSKVLGVGDDVSASAGAKPQKLDGRSLLLAMSQRDSQRLILSMSMQQPLYPVLLTKSSSIDPQSGVDQHNILQDVGGSSS